MSIDRIPDLIKELISEKNARIKTSIKKCYGVILADVWNETQPKKNILDSYIAGMKDKR